MLTIPTPAEVARRRHTMTIILRTGGALLIAVPLLTAGLDVVEVQLDVQSSWQTKDLVREALLKGYWVLAGVAAIAAAGALSRALVPEGTSGCPECGYELHDSAGQCPECGTPVVATSPARLNSEDRLRRISLIASLLRSVIVLSLLYALVSGLAMLMFLLYRGARAPSVAKEVWTEIVLYVVALGVGGVLYGLSVPLARLLVPRVRPAGEQGE